MDEKKCSLVIRGGEEPNIINGSYTVDVCYCDEILIFPQGEAKAKQFLSEAETLCEELMGIENGIDDIYAENSNPDYYSPWFKENTIDEKEEFWTEFLEELRNFKDYWNYVPTYLQEKWDELEPTD